jgi:Cu(I)/Ag(I) efflux system membrane protein CusA/SilA
MNTKKMSLLIVVLFAGLLVFFRIFQKFYQQILAWCLAHKVLFLPIPMLLLIFGGVIWMDFGKVFFFVPQQLRANYVWSKAAHTFPGLGKEFMPPLDEGSFLYLPTAMPHESIGECLERRLFDDLALYGFPSDSSGIIS